MTARGIHCSAVGAHEYEDRGLVTTLASGDRVDMLNEDFVCCYWQMKTGNDSAASDYGDQGFDLNGSYPNPGIAGTLSGLNGAAPWKFQGRYHDPSSGTGITMTDSAALIAASTPFFVAYIWNHTTKVFTRYHCFNGDTSLVSQASSTVDYTAVGGGHAYADVLYIGNHGLIIESDITNFKAWKGSLTLTNFTASSNAGLLAEKNNETPQYGSGASDSSLLCWLKLASGTDTTDYSPRALTFSANGSLTSGTMDPSDLVVGGGGGGGGSADVGFQNLEHPGLSGGLTL